MPARASVSEDHGTAGGPAGVYVRRVLEYLFNLLLRDTMLGTVLHVAIGVVIEIPDNRVEWQ